MSFLYDHEWHERHPFLGKTVRMLERAGAAVVEGTESLIARVQTMALEHSSHPAAVNYVAGNPPTGAWPNPIPPGQPPQQPSYSGPTGSIGQPGQPIGAVALPQTARAQVGGQRGRPHY